MRYQWRHNGGNVPGAITRSLTISNVQLADAGVYSVAVFNNFGAVESELAELNLGNIPAVQFSDSFAGAPHLQGTAGLVRSSNAGASAEGGEPSHHGRPPRRTVWATWAAPTGTSGGIVTFRTAGSTFDTLLAVYTGTLSGGLVPVRSDDDGGGFLSSEVSFRAQPQTLYRIVVDGFGGAEGKFLFDWKFELTSENFPIFTEEPFDQAVALGRDVTFSVAGVTDYAWQWYFNGMPLTGQTQSMLLVKGVGPLQVGDYFCRGFNGQRFRNTRTARLQINHNQFGQVDPFSFSSEKLFDSRLRANDFAAGSRAKSVAHGFSGTQIFSTVGATKEIGEPNHCGIPGGASEWFAVQAETNGTMFIDTDGSNFDTVLAVYIGPGDSYATLTNVACDNDSGLDGKDSRVSFPATQGTIYWIAVDGVNNPSNGNPAKGSVTLHYRLVLPLRLSATAYTNAAGGRMSFRVTGTPNLPTTIEVTTDIAAISWTSLVTNTTSSGVFNFTNSGVGVIPRRFYRAVNKF